MYANTNASYNRSQAIKLFKHGFTAQQIANEFSLVFALDSEGKLDQIYDYTLSDGRKETNTMISMLAVQDMIDNTGYIDHE